MKKKAINKKIDELFEYRKLPQLLSKSNIAKQERFLQNLKALQLSIYYLDDYLETNRNCKKSKLKKYWQRIYKDLDAFKLSKKEKDQFCVNIKEYQKRELALRDGQFPVDTPFKKHYLIKSCDVNLMRMLIYKMDPRLKKVIRLKDWEDYDFITEVNDDVEDLFEDIKIYNCNRFMLSIALLGKTETLLSFSKALGKTAKRTSKISYKPLRKLTAQRIQETKALLKKQIRKSRIKQVKNAKVFK